MTRLSLALLAASLLFGGSALADDEPTEAEEPAKKVVVTKEGKKRTVVTFDETDAEVLSCPVHTPTIEYLIGRPEIVDDALELTVPERVDGVTVDRPVPSRAGAKKRADAKKKADAEK